MFVEKLVLVLLCPEDLLQTSASIARIASRKSSVDALIKVEPPEGLRSSLAGTGTTHGDCGILFFSRL